MDKRKVGGDSCYPQHLRYKNLKVSSPYYSYQRKVWNTKRTWKYYFVTTLFFKLPTNIFLTGYKKRSIIVWVVFATYHNVTIIKVIIEHKQQDYQSSIKSKRNMKKMLSWIMLIDNSNKKSLIHTMLKSTCCKEVFWRCKKRTRRLWKIQFVNPHRWCVTSW